ncbi:MAG: IclR family transcriptional regulator [Actinomycetota bacterium]
MQAIERTFSILGALAEHPERAGISEIARRADLPKSTTSRILASLESLGMVERIGDQYGIGAALETLTHRASPIGSLREIARAQLVELADTLGENASLVVDDEDMVLYIDTAVPEDTQVQVQDWTGERLPFHTAAAGLSLMSTWDPARIAALCASDLEAFTDKTVTTPSGVREKLAELDRDGVVWTIQEFSDDVNGVGVPILGPDGTAIGAINVYGPTYRFPTDDIDGINAAMIDAAQRIATRLVGE